MSDDMGWGRHGLALTVDKRKGWSASSERGPNRKSLGPNLRSNSLLCIRTKPLVLVSELGQQISPRVGGGFQFSESHTIASVASVKMAPIFRLSLLNCAWWTR
jgi:hypothetical protein